MTELAIPDDNARIFASLDRAKRALAEAHSIPEVKDIRDKAEAIRHYYRQQADSLESQNYAAELKLRAEHKLGEMLAETEKNPGTRMAGSNIVLPPDTATLSDLGIERMQSHRWQRVASVPMDRFEQEIEEVKQETGELTTARILRVASEIEREQAGQEQVSVPLPKGQYRCIVVDPPWPTYKIDREERPLQAAVLDYPVMSIDDLYALPVGDFTATDGCHLYLWATQKFVPTALALAEAWGFVYQCLLTWVKPTGMTPYSWMYNTEHVIFAHRGGLRLQQLGLKLSFEGHVIRHSEKPAVFYERVRAASPNPRLDMFARQTHEGFTPWGNEV